MRKTPHDGLQSGSLSEIDVDAWIKNKNNDALNKNFYRHKFSHNHRQNILEQSNYRNRVEGFSSIEDAIFAEDGKECDVNLLDQEKSVLLLDKRTCCS